MRDGMKRAAAPAAVILLGLCVVIFLFLPRMEQKTQAPAPFEVRAIDVGKADALLITTLNSTVLIDTGEDEDGQDIVSYLRETGRTVLDYLIITHFDKDHVGGADILMEQLEVKHIYQTNTQKDSRDYEEYLEAAAQKDIETVTVNEVVTFELDGAKYTVYPPGEHYNKKKSNNSSLIVGVEFGETDFLFTGDAMQERVAEYLEKYGAGTYDVVKMPYHGNYMDNLPEFLDTVNPEYALITSSDEKKEDERTMAELQKRGVNTFLTRKGSITVESDGKEIRVRQSGG